MVTTVLAGVALISTLFLREYSVDRKTVYSRDVRRSSRDGEKSMSESMSAGQSAETGDLESM